MNKRIVLSSMSIFASLALVTGATFAFFSDSGTTAGNTFASGSLALALDDDPDGSIAATFAANNLAPGVPVDTGSIKLSNVGSLSIAEIEFMADLASGDTALPGVLNITSIKTGSDATCTTNQVERVGAVTAGVGNGLAPLTLQELIDTSGYDALPGILSTEAYFMCMTTTMDATAGNEHQGKSSSIDFIFTANQDASQ